MSMVMFEAFLSTVAPIPVRNSGALSASVHSGESAFSVFGRAKKRLL